MLRWRVQWLRFSCVIVCKQLHSYQRRWAQICLRKYAISLKYLGYWSDVGLSLYNPGSISNRRTNEVWQVDYNEDDPEWIDWSVIMIESWRSLSLVVEALGYRVNTANHCQCQAIYIKGTFWRAKEMPNVAIPMYLQCHCLMEAVTVWRWRRTQPTKSSLICRFAHIFHVGYWIKTIVCSQQKCSIRHEILIWWNH